MTARLIEGQFPITKRHPEGASRPPHHRAHRLTSALRRVSVMAKSATAGQATLSPTVLKLSASSQDLGEAEESIDVDYGGAEVTIASFKYVRTRFPHRQGHRRARIQDG